MDQARKELEVERKQKVEEAPPAAVSLLARTRAETAKASAFFAEAEAPLEERDASDEKPEAQFAAAAAPPIAAARRSRARSRAGRSAARRSRARSGAAASLPLPPLLTTAERVGARGRLPPGRPCLEL